jgi:hypothetical protein
MDAPREKLSKPAIFFLAYVVLAAVSVLLAVLLGRHRLLGIIVAQPLLVLGLAHMLWPVQMWHFTHFLMVKDGEPSDWYMASAKPAGVVLILSAYVGVWMMSVM